MKNIISQSVSLYCEGAGVVKLPDYLRSRQKDVNRRQNNLLSLTAVIICLATVYYLKIIHSRKSGRPMQVNGTFHSIEESRLIIVIINYQNTVTFNNITVLLSF